MEDIVLSITYLFEINTKNFSPDQLKQYRKEMKEAHPDTGGSHEKFLEFTNKWSNTSNSHEPKTVREAWQEAKRRGREEWERTRPQREAAYEARQQAKQQAYEARQQARAKRAEKVRSTVSDFRNKMSSFGNTSAGKIYDIGAKTIKTTSYIGSKAGSSLYNMGAKTIKTTADIGSKVGSSLHDRFNAQFSTKKV